MEKQKNIPALRFPEFDGEWEMKKIGEIGEVITGSTPPTDNSSYYNGEYLFVSPADIQNNRFVKETKTTLTLNGFLKGRTVKSGSSFFVCIGSSIGKVGQATEDCITNQQINSVASYDDNSRDFIYSLLEYNSSRIKILAAEQAVPIINKTTFSKFTIYSPTLPEQQKIAQFFTSIDQKITQLKKKKELLEQYKKGVMQKIFSQQIRFKPDNGGEFPEWEKLHGNDLFTTISNKNHNSDLPILAITQEHGAVPRDMIDYYITVSDQSVESYKVVEKGDFIISLRSFQGGIEYSNYKGVCSPAYIILRAIEEIDSRYFKFYFKTQSYITELNRKLEGIRDGKMISFKYFSDIKINVPSLPEQTKIANFLSAIDDKIQHTQKQTEQTEQWKKGLMQRMFV